MTFLLVLSSVFAVPVLLENQMANIEAQEFGTHLTLMFLFVLAMIVLFYSNLLNGTIQVMARHSMAKRSLAFAGRELRFLMLIPFSLVVALASTIGFIILSVVVSIITGEEVRDLNRKLVVGVFPIGALVWFFFWVWLNIRLAPLFGFIALENRFAVRDAWRASRGNFWRIFAIIFLVWVGCLVITIPGYVLGAIFVPIDLSGLAGFDLNSSESVRKLMELSQYMQRWNNFVLPFSIYGLFAITAAIGKVYLTLVPSSNADEKNMEQEVPPETRVEPS